MPSVRKLQELAGFETELEVPPEIDSVPALPAAAGLGPEEAE